MQSVAETVLIDTGIGAGYAPDRERLLAGLASVGVAPGDVDVVFLTHVHGDHVLCTVDGNGRSAFPNARYLMGRAEWAFWIDEAALQTESEWAARKARQVLPALADVLATVADGERGSGGGNMIGATN